VDTAKELEGLYHTIDGADCPRCCAAQDLILAREKRMFDTRIDLKLKKKALEKLTNGEEKMAARKEIEALEIKLKEEQDSEK